MSLTTIRDGVVSILTAAGAKNVEAEEERTLRAEPDRMMDGHAVHYWRVRASRMPGMGGAGYIDRRHRFEITGTLGLSRDDADSETRSDLIFGDLVNAVVAALESPANAHPGTAIDREAVEVVSTRKGEATVGDRRVPAHIVTITCTYVSED